MEEAADPGSSGRQQPSALGTPAEPSTPATTTGQPPIDTKHHDSSNNTAAELHNRHNSSSSAATSLWAQSEPSSSNFPYDTTAAGGVSAYSGGGGAYSAADSAPPPHSWFGAGGSSSTFHVRGDSQGADGGLPGLGLFAAGYGSDKAAHSRNSSAAALPPAYSNAGAALSARHSRTSSINMPHAGDILLGNASAASSDDYAWMRASTSLGPAAAASNDYIAPSGHTGGTMSTSQSVFDFLKEFDEPVAVAAASEPADGAQQPAAASTPAPTVEAASTSPPDDYSPLVLPGAASRAARLSAADGARSDGAASPSASQPGDASQPPASGSAGAGAGEDPSGRDLELLAALPRHQVSLGNWSFDGAGIWQTYRH